MKKILILYARTGGGHLSLARSLEKSLHTNFPGQFDIALENSLPKFYDFAYEQFGTNFKWFWGKLFYLTNNPLLAKLSHFQTHFMIQKRLVNYITHHQPDLIVSNNPFVTSEISHALKKANHQAKIVLHFADPFTLHHLWLTEKNADLYLSPTNEATDIAIKNGIPQSKMATVGWLIRDQFNNHVSQPKKIKNDLGLDSHKFIILIGGGGQGGGKIFEAAKKFLHSKIVAENCQILAVAGRNKNLYQKLKDLREKYPEILFPFSYVENMADLMSCSDLVVGKAGPNFLFESIFMVKPFLATGRLPGQEDSNLGFIVSEKLGWAEEDLSQATTIVEAVITNPELLRPKSANAKRIKKLHQNSHRLAAQAIVDLLSSNDDT